MNTDQLFLYTLRELVDRTKNGTSEYDVLMSALPLRKLLLDKRALVHEVNRVRCERLAFRIADSDLYVSTVMEDRPAFYAAYDGLAPGLGPFARSREVNLKQLLATRVMRASDIDVTVRDVISQVANIEGAVHLGVPRGEKQRVLHVMSAQLKVGGQDGVVRTLRGIAEVVGDGLVPLTKRILEDRGIDVSEALRRTRRISE